MTGANGAAPAARNATPPTAAEPERYEGTYGQPLWHAPIKVALINWGDTFSH